MKTKYLNVVNKKENIKCVRFKQVMLLIQA